MVVQVKVLKNADEINEAKAKNQRYANQRTQNNTLPKTKRVLVPDDVEIPEQDLDVSEILLDAKDIMRARINEIGMISIVHLGQEMQIIYTDEVWEQIKQRFSTTN